MKPSGVNHTQLLPNKNRIQLPTLYNLNRGAIPLEKQIESAAVLFVGSAHFGRKMNENIARDGKQKFETKKILGKETFLLFRLCYRVYFSLYGFICVYIEKEGATRPKI